MTQNIAPVQNTNNIRYADFVRVTTPDATYRFATTPAVMTIPAVDPEPFTAVGVLMKVGDAVRDIKSTANETTFSFVGIDTSMLGWVLGNQIKGAQIEAWHGFFDANNVLIGNLLNYSQNYTNENWYNYNCVITENATTAPDGTLTASKVSANGTAPSLIFQLVPISKTGTGKQCSSVYAKASTANTFVFNTYFFSDTETNITFTLSGSGSTSNPSISSIESVGDGWYRCTVTNPELVNSSSYFQYRLWPQARDSANTGSVYFWGSQLNVGTQSSTYTKTLSSISGLYKFFNGYVNSFSISEQWMEEIRQYVGTIAVAASSIQIILKNRVAGRYTNNSSWQFFNAGDTSMNRVAFIQTINYQFGKGNTDPNS